MHFYIGRKVIRRVPGTVIKAVPLPEPAVTEGFGARDQIGPICVREGLRSALLVTDQTLFGLGLHEKVRTSLEKHGVQCAVFHEIDSEPTVDIVDAGRKAAVDCGADCIVALGGGSVLDSAKVIAAGARHPQWGIRHYLHKFAIVEGRTLPMIGIPSTAGTGAECTVGAVVKGADGVKKSTVIVGLHIPHVILDSELTVGAPRSVTVWCGIDALSHGLEGLLADVRSGEENERRSRECVRLVLENLPRLLEEPGDIEARQAMALAAFHGGNAINTQLAGYVHAFAHSIGALYHIPHGKAIAWCLIPVVRAQLEIRRDVLADLARHCGIAAAEEPAEAAAEKMLAALRDLLDRCGLEKGCAALRTDDYDRLIQMIDSDSINYSPSRTFTDDEIRGLLDRIGRGD